MKKIIALIMLIVVIFLSGCTTNTNSSPAPNNASSNVVMQNALYPVNINGKFGFLDVKGNLVVQPKYDMASDFNDGLGLVLLKDKWGFIDSTGKEVIPPQYKNQPTEFKNGLSRTLDNDGKAVFYDTQGKIIWKEK